ncbi:hypothetical protein BU23DRAFT_219137 [Bimuria novae-zelandiae CBS 107.79]|uniref:Prion-inhibition and propagation HeLo domain-containing protein n=1 Tax=Bimuria novae-zelandiae CBS 107.79 TaxID=1447943 RepID=A0A6A5UYU3_9PLEO|nr:hypothetical protein BU23DRAFT_219137 [Bimuria novae-zelandiae CBS 107.79]
MRANLADRHSVAMDGTIMLLSTECSRLFEQLTSSLSDIRSQYRSSLRPELVNDQFERYKLWAGNLGAFQNSQPYVSIDYRLRKSPKVASQLKELLNILINSIRDVLPIALGERPNRHIDRDEHGSGNSSDSESKITDSPIDEPLPSEASEASELFELAN